MKLKITYIFHNCFILTLPSKTFLFDYPADEYLTNTMRSIIISKIKDTELYVLSSHNHHDHFNRNVVNFANYTKSITYVLSRDIIIKNRQFKVMASCYQAAADQTYQINDFKVQTFLSNDEGVAFLIHLGNQRIYFGGDLANWNWDDLTKEEHRLLVDHFSDVLENLKQQPIDIAFSNTDARLKNWAGAAQFIEVVKPKLFIPMHTFGKTESITEFLTENAHLKTDIFKYRETGDSMIIEL